MKTNSLATAKRATGQFSQLTRRFENDSRRNGTPFFPVLIEEGVAKVDNKGHVCEQVYVAEGLRMRGACRQREAARLGFFAACVMAGRRRG